MKKLQFALIAVALIAFASACKKGGSGKTKSGFDYTIHKKNSGKTPKEGDFAYAEMYVRKDTQLIFSTKMSGQDAQFQIKTDKKVDNPIYKMITEGLQLLAVGDSATFSFNVDTMKTKPREFEGGKQAIITLVMKKIQTEDEFVATLNPQQKTAYQEMKIFQARAIKVADSTSVLAKNFAAGKLPANVQTTASGLKYAILNQGNGAQATKGMGVAVHYYGSLTNGTQFDQSYEGGQPFPFLLGQGQVIPGWDEGIALLKEGTTAVLFVPAALAYGDKVQPGGPIPPNADLVFYVDLMKVFDPKTMGGGAPPGGM
jgi:FKBP-type peptidyl-prolyl cis-trans isomerase FkpA